jgi:hypothetical protein
MRPELDDQLCQRYPKIFQDRTGDPSTTLMCWGFDVGDGWYGIIDSACHVIQSHVSHSIKHREWTIEHNRKVREDPTYKGVGCKPYDERPVPDAVEQVVALQVKEKYGTLRFYCHGGDDYTQGVLDMAETLSSMTCERCGAPGQLRDGGWMRTLCEQHHVAESLGADPSFLP